MKVVIITGSVGTGKTTLAKKLAKNLNYRYIDVNKLIEKEEISSGYDRKRRCKIIDIRRLNNLLINLINNSKKNLIIDSHLSHYLPKKYVDLCVVTKCDLKVLEKRLRKRGYTKDKIRENLDCEIFDICLNEAKELRHRVIVIDTTKGINISEISKVVKKWS